MLFFGVAKGLDTKLRKKTLRRSTLLPYVASTLSKCRPAAAEGAKLSTIRRGARTSCRRVGRPLVEKPRLKALELTKSVL